MLKKVDSSNIYILPEKLVIILQQKYLHVLQHLVDILHLGLPCLDNFGDCFVMTSPSDIDRLRLPHSNLAREFNRNILVHTLIAKFQKITMIDGTLNIFLL